MHIVSLLSIPLNASILYSFVYLFYIYMCTYFIFIFVFIQCIWLKAWYIQGKLTKILNFLINTECTTSRFFVSYSVQLNLFSTFTTMVNSQHILFLSRELSIQFRKQLKISVSRVKLENNNRINVSLFTNYQGLLLMKKKITINKKNRELGRESIYSIFDNINLSIYRYIMINNIKDN